MTPVAVLLLWLAAGYRLHMLRKAPGFINASYAVAATGLALAFAVKAAGNSIDSVTGPYVSDLVEHLLVVVAGVGAQLFLLALRDGAPPRRSLVIRAGIAAAVGATMTAAFLAAPLRFPSSAELDEAYGNLAAIAVYRLIFNIHLTYVLVDNIRLCRRYAAIPGDPGRSISLTLVGWGSAVALTYSTSRIAYTLVDTLTGHAPAVIRAVGSEAAAVGLCGLAVGMLAPRVVSGMSSWSDARQGGRRLQPLWSELTGCFPALALPTGRGVGPRAAELRYDRQLLEVAEGLSRVHLPRCSPDTATSHAEAVQVLARELYRSRGSWAQPDGPSGSDVLPPARDRAE